MNDEYETISDVELTIGHLRFIRDAGASDVFMELIKFDAASVGISRNSVEQEVESYVFRGHLSGDPDDFSPYGGHFFTAMWEGDLFGAWTRADMNNKALMLEVFGKLRIIGSAVEQGKEASYARSMMEA